MFGAPFISTNPGSSSSRRVGGRSSIVPAKAASNDRPSRRKVAVDVASRRDWDDLVFSVLPNAG
jgi:hypothetical protein